MEIATQHKQYKPHAVESVFRDFEVLADAEVDSKSVVCIGRVPHQRQNANSGKAEKGRHLMGREWVV